MLSYLLEVAIKLNHRPMYLPEFTSHSRFLVTGGTGFIGIWLLDALLKLNDSHRLECKFTVLTRDPSRFLSNHPTIANHQSVSLLAGDVVTVNLQEEYFDYLIHGAAVSAFWDDPGNYFETIVMGTRNVMYWAKRNKVAKILFLSSGAIYGEPTHDLEQFDETTLSAPEIGTPGAVYGESKRCAEMLVHLLGSDHADVTIARLFSFFGPLMPIKSHFAFSQFMSCAVKNEDIIVDNPEACRSYMYVENVAESLSKLLKKNNNHQIYNIGGDVRVTMLELAKIIAKETGSSSKVIARQSENINKARSIYLPKVSRFLSEFDLEGKISLEQGIKLTRQWFRGGQHT